MTAKSDDVGYHVYFVAAVLEHSRFEAMVRQYKTDPESVYSTWFIDSADRLKAFRSIRRGVEQVIAEIKAGTFDNDFRGSSLELVLNSITEQQQVFEGAAPSALARN